MKNHTALEVLAYRLYLDQNGPQPLVLWESLGPEERLAYRVRALRLVRESEGQEVGLTLVQQDAREERGADLGCDGCGG